MAVLFLDSFSHYDTAQIGRKWNFAGTPTIVLADRGPPFGAMQFSAAGDSVFKGVGVLSTVATGFGLFAPSLPSGTNNVLVGLGLGSASSCCLCLTSTGALSIHTGGAAGPPAGTSAAGVVTAGVYHFVEAIIHISTGSGTATVRVDGVTVLTLVVSDTDFAGFGIIDEVHYNSDSAGAGGWSVWRMGDLYILDTTGTVNNALIGPVVVEALAVVGPGASADWTIAGTAPALTNWGSVEEVPPDDLVTFVESRVVGETDTYEVSTPSLIPTLVLCVQPVYCCQSATPGVSTFATAVNDGISTQTTGVNFPNLSFTFVTLPLDTDPFTSLPWLNDPSLYSWGQQLLS